MSGCVPCGAAVLTAQKISPRVAGSWPLAISPRPHCESTRKAAIFYSFLEHISPSLHSYQA